VLAAIVWIERTSPMKLFESGERVHLINRKGRHYPIVLRSGGVYQFSGETLPHDDIIGKPEGSEVQTSRETRFIALRPTLSEYVLKMPRGAQVIYPKDLGTILLWADIYPGATVVEAGMGSGALTMALIRAVGDKGHVTSYEIREDFARRAIANVTDFLGPVPNHTLKQKDVYKGIDDRDVDRLLLDLPEPWNAVPHATKALRSGGIFICLLPTVPQVEQVMRALRAEHVFSLFETFETMFRTWVIDGPSVRPDHRMVAHTAFLTVARKVASKKKPKG
jgi:tRNA (adenine57-N1/adenine58-N1)-methyltransferase catalytic subunit